MSKFPDWKARVEKRALKIVEEDYQGVGLRLI